jgi:hypothetical protein
MRENKLKNLPTIYLISFPNNAPIIIKYNTAAVNPRMDFTVSMAAPLPASGF